MTAQMRAPPPNFSLKLSRPDFGSPPTPPPHVASVTASRRPQFAPSGSHASRGCRRAAPTSARGTGRAGTDGKLFVSSLRQRPSPL